MCLCAYVVVVAVCGHRRGIIVETRESERGLDAAAD